MMKWSDAVEKSLMALEDAHNILLKREREQIINPPYNTIPILQKNTSTCASGRTYTKALTMFITRVRIMKGIMDSFYFLFVLIHFFLKSFLNEYMRFIFKCNAWLFSLLHFQYMCTSSLLKFLLSYTELSIHLILLIMEV